MYIASYFFYNGGGDYILVSSKIYRKDNNMGEIREYTTKLFEDIKHIDEFVVNIIKSVNNDTLFYKIKK